VPLPDHLHALFAQSRPNLVTLCPDDVLQLAAYLAHPDPNRVSMSALAAEKRHGGRTYQEQIDEHAAWHRYLKSNLNYNRGLAETASTAGRKGGPGRRSDTDPKADQRVSEAWSTGQYKTYADLGAALGQSGHDVKKAIDRHRKRKAAK